MKMKPTHVLAEQIWPLAGVYGDVVVTRKGVLCMGWELTLPEMYSCTEDEYDEIAGSFAAALRVLPPWCVVHRQDVYLKEVWHPDSPKGGKPYLVKAYDDYFDGREYMTERSYIFVSWCRKGHVEKGGRASGIFGIEGDVKVPQQEAFEDWRVKCTEFAAVLSRGGSGRIRTRVLREKDWMGEGGDPGIVQRYLLLGNSTNILSDIELDTDGIAIEDRRAMVFSVGESGDISTGETATVRITDLGSPEGGDLLLSNGSPVGVELDCEHVVNHIFVLPSQQEVMRALEQEKNKMLSGIRSVDNRVNAGEIQAFLDAAYRDGLYVVRTNMSVIAWDRGAASRDLMAKVTAALNQMKVTSKHAQFNAPVVWYAGAPGCASEIGSENLMKMELMSSLCLGGWEGYDRGFDGGHLRLSDRFRRIPMRFDMHRIAERNNLISNYNQFALGTSGSGKSFFTNKMSMDSYYAGGTEFIIDAGDSYQGLSYLINEESHGRDGAYLAWDEEHPMTFDAFAGWEDWLTPDGALILDEGSSYFMALLQMIYQPDENAPNRGWSDQRRTVLIQTIVDFLSIARQSGRKPIFDDYYRFIDGEVQPKVLYVSAFEDVSLDGASDDWQARAVKVKEQRDEDYRLHGYFIGASRVTPEMFNAKDFATALRSYSKEGVHGRLLNNPAAPDYFNNRHVVVEVQALANLARNGEKKYYGVCILSIMNQIDLKMRAGGSFKTIRIDEAWQAIANEAMAGYIRGLYKTARKYDCAMCVITQELADIMTSPVVKTAIIGNSQIKILLDQRENRSCFDDIQSTLGLTDKDRALVLSMNRNPRPGDNTREVFINWGGLRSAVYAVEVSPRHALVFESNREAKKPLFRLARERGSFIAAVEELAGAAEDEALEQKVMALPPGRRESFIARMARMIKNIGS